MKVISEWKSISKFSLLLIGILLVLCSGCRERRPSISSFFDHTKFDEDDFVATLTPVYSKYAVTDSVWKKQNIHSVDEMMHRTYQTNQYFPIWMDEDGDTRFLDELVKDLETVYADGLDPERYQLSALKQQIKQLKDSSSPHINSIIALDTLSTRAYLQASHDLLFGMISPKTADHLWFHSNDSTWAVDTLLTRSLYVSGLYTPLSEFRSTIPMYQALSKIKGHTHDLVSNAKFMSAKEAIVDGNRSDSVVSYIIETETPWVADDTYNSDSIEEKSVQQLIKHYQSYYGLKSSGKLDSSTVKYLKRQPRESFTAIDANLERLRWMPRELGNMYIFVNVPLMELFFRNGGEEVMRMRVIVGKPDRQTPTLDANMQHVVFNPSWGVPPTILKKDVLPGIQQSGAAYLAKKGLRVYDRRGRQVSAAAVNGGNIRNYMFRQPPGHGNALGNIKFNMPNRFDIYLHDTPNRNLFGNSERALSSGCIRVQQPREMAEYILSHVDKKDYDQNKIESLINTQSTKFVTLDHKIPVHIVYITAVLDSKKHVQFVKDIYNRDDKLITALQEQSRNKKESDGKDAVAVRGK